MISIQAAFHIRWGSCSSLTLRPPVALLQILPDPQGCVGPRSSLCQLQLDGEMSCCSVPLQNGSPSFGWSLKVVCIHTVYKCINMCVHIYVYMHIYMCIYMHIYMRTYLNIFTYTYTYTWCSVDQPPPGAALTSPPPLLCSVDQPPPLPPPPMV